MLTIAIVARKAKVRSTFRSTSPSWAWGSGTLPRCRRAKLPSTSRQKKSGRNLWFRSPVQGEGFFRRATENNLEASSARRAIFNSSSPSAPTRPKAEPPEGGSRAKRAKKFFGTWAKQNIKTKSLVWSCCLYY